MSAVYTTTMTTPRLRVPRKAPLYNDRSRSSTTTTDFAGPSRLPEISQLVDVDLNEMAGSETSEQPTVISKVSTPSTVARSETPAAVLRALLSRLPSENRSPTPSQTPDQYPSERESDYDMSEHASATPRMAQEIVKDIFSKARRDPDGSPLKVRPRRNSVDTSEVESSRVVQYDRTIEKGKTRSLSDDDNDETNMASTSQSRRKSRSMKQPLTADFLRERFSQSFVAPTGEDTSNHSSNETATMLRDFDASHASPPMATSTPQQSMRMSVEMDIHSNLLEQDTEMQHAIEGMDSFEGESNNNPSVSTLMFQHKGITPTAKISTHHNYVDSEDDGSRHTSSRSKPRYSLTPRPMRYGNTASEDSAKKNESTIHRSRLSHTNPRTSHSDEERDEVEESLQSNISPEHSFRMQDAGSQSFYDRQEVEESLKSLVDEGVNFLSHQSFMEQREVEESLQSGFEQDQSSYFPEVRVQSSRERDEVEESLHNFSARNRSHRVEHIRRPDSEAFYEEGSHTPLQDATLSSRSHHSSATPVRGPTIAHGKTLDWDSVWRETSKVPLKSSTPPPLADSPRLIQDNDNITRPESRNQSQQPQRQKLDPSFVSEDTSLAYITQQKALRNTPSPQLSAPHNPTPNRTSSLRPIDNIYHNNDLSLRRPPSQTSSPLSPSKKRPASPSVSSISTRKMKTSIATPSNMRPDSPNIPQINSSRFHPRSKNDLSNQSSRRSSEQDSYSSMSLTQIQQNGHDNYIDADEPETDDAGCLDLSSRGEILRSSSKDFVDMDTNSGVETGLTPRASRQGSYVIPPGTPSLFLEENTPHGEGASSPSTPPRRSTPKISRREYRTPSPSEKLPELPTPSSSDEADNSPVRNKSTKSHVADREESHWMSTSSAPGGWGVTPKPSRESTHLRETESTDEPRQSYPSTPANTDKYTNNNRLDTIGKTPKPPGGWFTTPEPGPSNYTHRASEDASEQHETQNNFSAIGKTPKPPGAWSATPAPGSSSTNGINRRFIGEGDSEHNAGLLTPMSTLSKGASLDPKTPGLPGGWLATPAVRKSILKVRFNPETPAGPSDRLGQIEESSQSSNFLQPSSSSLSPLPPSPRSPRRSKSSGIRVVDAFGREQEAQEAKAQSLDDSKSMLRIVDALGREVNVPDASSVEVEETEILRDLPYPGRRELLSRIRRGLDDLADDFGSTEEDEDDLASRKRIQELQATSEQARKAREDIKSGSTFANVLAEKSSVVESSLRPRTRLRFYVVSLIILLSSFLLMYRGLSYHFYRQYFTAYYDPFNPELYGPDLKSFSHLFDPRLSKMGDTLSQVDGSPWYKQVPKAADIFQSIWNLWEEDPVSSSKTQWLYVPT